MQTDKGGPALSVVVIIHNMVREASRTLYSLSTDYQRNINGSDYEVIVIDNGSNPPLDSSVVCNLAGNFRLIYLESASPSPAAAINRALREARGDIVGVMIDGARIATPGLLHFALHGARLYENAAVLTLGWYLGYDFQTWAISCGYDQTREDALLDSIGWPKDGYRLYEIGTMDESSIDGWFQPPAESNALFLSRQVWERLGGVDERFDNAGGGMINLDTCSRLLEMSEVKPVILLGEATFHQMHGGTNTNATRARQLENWTLWSQQFETIRGYPWTRASWNQEPTYLGILPDRALARFTFAAIHPAPQFDKTPLQVDFESSPWQATDEPAAVDVREVLNLAKNEFREGRMEAACAVTRLLRRRSPELLESQRMLSYLSGSIYADDLPAIQRRAGYHLALGQAHEIMGENEDSRIHYYRALDANPNLAEAHLGLARLKMPGDGYLTWLDRLYRILMPETVVEIGVYEGASLALLSPPTIAVGIDPAPRILHPLKAQTHLFAETSDEFFARPWLGPILDGKPLSIGFIDGLHLFEQALRDFINLERVCGPRSLIVFHDTVPLNEATQTRIQQTQFHTGDVWKVIPALKHYRPELQIFTIATPPTGLTLVMGLDADSRILADEFEEIVGRFVGMQFGAIEGNLTSMLNLVSNDWKMAESQLRVHGLIPIQSLPPG